MCFCETSNPQEPNTGEAGEAGVIPASSIRGYPPPSHVHTRTRAVSQMIAGSCNPRPTDYIGRQAGRIVYTHIHKKANAIKPVALLELHLPVV